MLQSHIKIMCSASSIESLKLALQSIIDRLDDEEMATVFHDDFNYTFETFDNETLKTFEINPNEFLFLDLPNL
mgnify:CR=1 FL=1